MTLSIATSGYLPNRSPLCLVTDGYLCGGELPEPEPDTSGGGGVFYRQAFKLIKEDIEDRDYRIERREGKKLAEITAKKALRITESALVKEKAAEIAIGLGIPRSEAKLLLEARLQIEIIRQRVDRIEQLNQQTIAMIMTAILADE